MDSSPRVHAEHASAAEQQQAGRAARSRLPRPALARWRASPGRTDPVELLLGQATTRDPALVPLRHARMGVSPFTFFRGTALVMALDLAAQPDTALETQLCGDAHLSNFGLFASEDRTVVFDVNDFDETCRGPFEWDLKRLATSFVLAAADAGLPDDVGRAAAVEAAHTYRTTIEDYATMPIMRVWYDRLESSHVEEIVASSTGKSGRRAVRDSVARAEARDAWSVVRKLTRLRDGHREFLNEPPLLTRIPMTGPMTTSVREAFDGYRDSLSGSLRRLLDRFSIIGFAHKVVGVGSVGLYSWVVLLEGSGTEDLLVLQLKQAQRSVIDRSVPGSSVSSPDEPSPHDGRRVVEGQRLMQAAGDVFLGWTTSPLGGHYYGRQLRDMKWAPDPTSFLPAGLLAYARLTGTTLARAHARSGDPVPIASYLGLSDRADQAIGDFATAYAAQAALDFAVFSDAVRSGRLKSA
jgi:uncharacterized protein (DUF2252 family)